MQPLDSMRTLTTPPTSARFNAADFNVNCSTAWTPHHISVVKTFAPFYVQKHSEAFLGSKKISDAVSGVKALRRLRDEQQPQKAGQPIYKSLSKKTIGENLGTTATTTMTTTVGSGTGGESSEMLMITGHAHGNLVIWNAENNALVGSCLHYNNVTVFDLVVTDSLIYTVVEKNSRVGKKEDDIDVYVWSINGLELLHTLAAHEDAVKAISVDSTNEKRCATGGVDRTIYVWDLQKLPNPIARLTGHGMLISRILLKDQMIVSSSHDASLRLWDLKTQTCLFVGDGHQGPINTLYWFDLPSAISGIENGVYTISACSSGMIRCYMIETIEVKQKTYGTADLTSPQHTGKAAAPPLEKTVLSLVWSNKAHKSLTTEVCWDEDLVISSSASDGINFYMMSTKTNNKFPLGDTAVRRLAIDPVRKLLVAGTDSGQLLLVNYGPLVGTHTEGENVGILASLQPHLGSIVGIRLQRAVDGRWERLITAGNDQTIFTLDFNVHRDGKSFTGSGLRCFCEIPDTGSIMTASDNIGILWNPELMKKKEGPKKAVEGHAKRLAVLRYSDEHKKIISGGEEGLVRVWNVSTSDTNGKDEIVEPQMVQAPSKPDEKKEGGGGAQPGQMIPMAVDCQMNVRTMSHPCRHLIAVGVHRPGLSKAGAVGVINFVKGTWHVPLVPTYVFPEHVELLSWEPKSGATPASPPAPDKRHAGSQNAKETVTSFQYSLLALLRNGEVMQFMGDSSTSGKFIAQRQVIRESVSYSIEREQEANLPAPVPISATLVYPSVPSTVAPPPRISILSAEEKTLRGTETGTDIVEGTQAQFSALLDSTILDLRAVNQGSVFAVASTESGNTFAVNARGDVIFSVTYDGAVVDNPLSGGGDALAAFQQKSRRRRNLVHGPHEGLQAGGMSNAALMRAPPAGCLSVSLSARLVVIGYKDGVVMIFDFASRKVCRRLHAHSTSVYRCWILPGPQRVISTSIAGTLRFDPLYNRTIRGLTETESEREKEVK